eukprot:7831091-Pyramimonas_sp.AAC.1
MPELGLLPQLGRNNYLYPATVYEMMITLTELGLQMSYRAAWHIARKEIISRASPKCIDPSTWSATRAGIKHPSATLPRSWSI